MKPKTTFKAKPTLAECVFLVGGLLLEQAPKAILMTDEQLDNYFEPALQNFKDFFKLDFKEDFEPGDNFRTLVMDHVRRYLDTRHMRFGI